MSAVRVTACEHCGTLVEGDGQYCCAGCAMAAEIIHGAGLDRYYAQRTAPAPRPGARTSGWGDIPVRELSGGRSEVALRIDGLRCAACAWVIERLLQAVPGVEEVTVRFATGRATLRWATGVTDLPTLAGRIEALGYNPRAQGFERPADRVLLVRAGVAAFLAMNVMLLSASVYAGWLDGMSEREAALFRWMSLALATPAALWAAAPIHAAAWAGLRHRVLHMDLPVSIGVLAMWGHGVVATSRGEDGWLDSLTMLVALLLAGRMVEQRGRRRAVEAADALAGTAPRRARRVQGDAIAEVDVDDLVAGDHVEVGTGEGIPADGIVESGRGTLSAALLTGEAEPVAVAEGSAVHAGTVLITGAVTVRVARVSGETVVAKMAAELAAAADRPAPPALTDRIAPWFTGATLFLATAGTGAWWWAAGAERALGVGMSILVVACPCALALAAPLATAAGLGAAARRGLLVRSGEALRALAEVDTVVFDKTGTLTEGIPVVVAADDEVLRVAAGLERASGHPIARAIVAEAGRRRIPLPEAKGVREDPGVGMSGTVDGVAWTLRAGEPGAVVLEGPDGQAGVLLLHDALRPEAARVVAALRERGIRVVLLTGDRYAVGARIAAAAGISEVIADQRPADKAGWIRARRDEGRRVLFVGDGVNDGPALAEADVGVAMGGGAASSLLVADGVVVMDGLSPVLAGLRAAEAARTALRGNAARSLAYNAGAVVAALAGLVNPLVAAVLMPLSSSLVLWGASRVARSVEEP